MKLRIYLRVFTEVAKKKRRIDTLIDAAIDALFGPLFEVFQQELTNKKSAICGQPYTLPFTPFLLITSSPRSAHRNQLPTRPASTSRPSVFIPTRLSIPMFRYPTCAWFHISLNPSLPTLITCTRCTLANATPLPFANPVNRPFPAANFDHPRPETFNLVAYQPPSQSRARTHTKQSVFRLDYNNATSSLDRKELTL
jgi:hypothetical protein